MKAQTAREILEILKTSDFDDFYRGELELWIQGDINAQSLEGILQEIANIFGVEVD